MLAHIFNTIINSDVNAVVITDACLNKEKYLDIPALYVGHTVEALYYGHHWDQKMCP